MASGTLPFLSTNEKTNLLYLTYYNIFSVLLSGLDVLGGLGGFGDDDEVEAGALGVEGSGGVESLHVCGWLRLMLELGKYLSFSP